MNKYKPEELDKFFMQAKELLADAQNKLRALELRDFIDLQYPREAEVIKKDIAEIRHSYVSLNNRVQKIEECLGIDFELDSCKLDEEVPAINYNFIQDDLLRDKATAYYREMLRYQYATRNHKQSFGEFCRLATIQIEFMLNYFFSDKAKIQLITDYYYEEAHKKWVSNGMTGPEPSKEEHKINKEDIYKIDLYIKSYIFNGKYLNGRKINFNTVNGY